MYKLLTCRDIDYILEIWRPANAIKQQLAINSFTNQLDSAIRHLHVFFLQLFQPSFQIAVL